MDLKKIRKAISYFLGWLGLISCSLIIEVTPGRFIYAAARNIASLGYILARKQRKIALEGLGLAFGREKTSLQIKRIVRDCFVFMAKSGVELLYLMKRPGLLCKRVAIEGENNLKAALARGKGVILVSAHFGNFPLMLARLSLAGYPVAAIMRPMKDRRVEKLFLSLRGKIRIKTIYSIPRPACVINSVRCLRNNELLFIPLDQNFGTGGVFVDFFGRKAATATGPVVLARRTQAAVLPCFIVRKKNDTHKIIFEPTMELAEGKNEEESTLINIQRITDIIEKYIRLYPAEWGWIHRRWKSRPKQQERGGG